jgi:hypothetical protein
MRIISVVLASMIVVAGMPMAQAGDQAGPASPPTATPADSGASSSAAPKPASPPATPATPAQPEPSNVLKTKTKSNQSND